MTYRQLTSEQRYMLARLRRQNLNNSEIAGSLGRHRSTVCRELGRNNTLADDRYRLLISYSPLLIACFYPLCS